MKPCKCDPPRYQPGQPFIQGRDCGICWEYHHNEKYRQQCDRMAQPTIIESAREFVQAMTAEIIWRQRGGKAPTAEEKAQRRALCNACPKHDTESDTCTLCGCYLEAGILPPRPFGKLDCSSQECPLKLWTYTSGYNPHQARGCCAGKTTPTT